MKYRTKDGDMVDQICRAHYGAEAGHTERVYAANPGLADLGPVLPSGVLIALHEPEIVPTTQIVRLWD